ncbi:hypothetical protein PISMIDRAFT_575332 [Pisolithus microcarpus 441]|uniref:SH3 domain-containing protein n=1 Tax=Pisolithus microcarpus 441 TaxID=765257 RepID=A0A0C9Y7L2_9AGAM|nr:hypothetical protein BKA83DRAFT_4182148 [Pisolithus microcarpus]KIK20690.1 hypothetical protein PISMIDRAFT_575332 [Pisolithus microcarpus 441]
MVFTRLSAQEKEAFFGLLDEYFQSRPDLFGNGSVAGTVAGLGISPATAASAVQRALSTAAADNKNNGGGSSTPGVRTVPGTPLSGRLAGNNPFVSSASAAATNPEAAHAAGRVAAAALAFSGGNNGGSTGGKVGTSPAPSTKGPPPGLPWRTSSTSTASTSSSQDPTSPPGSEVDKLVSKKNSVFSAFKKSNQPLAALPPAFAPPKNTFAPPPVRRAPSTSETSEKSSSPVPSAPSGRRVPAIHQSDPEPEPEPEPELEQQGEWVEALYDYNSEDPGDLRVEAGSRILVTARSSEDWWTGKIDGQGREGLFPASYVKLL